MGGYRTAGTARHGHTWHRKRDRVRLDTPRLWAVYPWNSGPDAGLVGCPSVLPGAGPAHDGQRGTTWTPHLPSTLDWTAGRLQRSSHSRDYGPADPELKSDYAIPLPALTHLTHLTSPPLGQGSGAPGGSSHRRFPGPTRPKPRTNSPHSWIGGPAALGRPGPANQISPAPGPHGRAAPGHSQQFAYHPSVRGGRRGYRPSRPPGPTDATSVHQHTHSGQRTPKG